jgi:hypothetical protein
MYTYYQVKSENFGIIAKDNLRQFKIIYHPTPVPSNDS